jgi:hypothetical protein
MHSHFRTKRTLLSAAVLAAVAVIASNAVAISQSGEATNMIRLGHTDLQGRPTYQPNVIQYPDGRTILFVGQHSGVPTGRVTACQADAATANLLPNPLDGNKCEANGTMIIDVTDPRNPVEQSLIPAPVVGSSIGQSQMVRMCLGSDLPGADPKKVYLLRNSQSNNPTISGYQLYDVTDTKNPVKVSEVMNLRSTHKLWWECSTGIAYMPGSKNSAPLWRQAQSMLIYDWSHPGQPGYPQYIRTFGLPGGQPTGTGPIATSLHGAISAHDHPQANQPLARARDPDDVIGNRIYAAWGVGNDGIVTILDRKTLLRPQWGGTYTGDPDSPAEADLYGANSPVVGYFVMSPDQGGHTSMPIFGLKPPSMQSFFDPDPNFAGSKNDNHFNVRDIVVVASEATADGRVSAADGKTYCNEPPHWAFTLDVTVENSFTTPPGTRRADQNSDGRVEHDAYQGPMVLGTMSVDPRSGAKYARGNYCTRGARFGVHSTNENFDNPYNGKLIAVAYFNGGVRLYDIREPQAPREVAFYVPEADALTDTDGYMTNNVEIDNRGYIYVVDRNGAGMDILDLTGCAKQLQDKGTVCPDLGNNNAGK